MSEQPDIKVLTNQFWHAYRALHDAWKAQTGGSMHVELQVRDAQAEALFQRRSAAAKKGASKRVKRPGIK